MQGKKKKAKHSGKAKGTHRLLTPTEIIEYYRKHHSLPPEIERRVGK